MFEAVEDLDLPQCTLAIRLVLKWTYFFDSHLLLSLVVSGRAACKHNTPLHNLVLLVQPIQTQRSPATPTTIESASFQVIYSHLPHHSICSLSDVREAGVARAHVEGLPANYLRRRFACHVVSGGCCILYLERYTPRPARGGKSLFVQSAKQKRGAMVSGGRGKGAESNYKGCIAATN